MLNPAAGSVAVAFWSHKVCRWLAPVALCVAQATSLALSADPWYALCASGLAMLAVLGLVGYRFDKRGRHWRPVSVPYYFLSMNLALLLGMFAFLRGTEFAVWRPTPRQLVPADGGGDAAVIVRAAPGLPDQAAAETISSGAASVM
jgi:hypothetical protein